MNKTVVVEVARVFTNKGGEYGNPVGVVMDEHASLSPEERQQVATQLGYSETVFINDAAAGELSIFDTTHEIPFAGHAVTGTAELISTLCGKSPRALHCGGMDIDTWTDDQGVRWIRAPLSITPSWNHEQLATPEDVERITEAEAAQKEHVFVWAWIDEEKGLMRARTFLPDWGILEDQGNGSGSMQRAAELGRELTIIHGLGSVIQARPAVNGMAEVGGRVTRDAHRTIELV